MALRVILLEARHILVHEVVETHSGGHCAAHLEARALRRQHDYTGRQRHACIHLQMHCAHPRVYSNNVRLLTHFATMLLRGSDMPGLCKQSQLPLRRVVA